MMITVEFIILIILLCTSKKIYGLAGHSYRIFAAKQRLPQSLLVLRANTKGREKSVKNNGRDVEKYLHLRELVRLQQNGVGYDELKEASINGTNSFSSKNAETSKRKGYEVLLGKKGTLDQRLRSIIAYKKSNNLASKTDSEYEVSEEELEGLEEDDDDIVYEEEKEIESAVLKIMETNKFRNFQDISNGKSNNETLLFGDTDPTSVIQRENVNESVDGDLYVPKVATWGVFPRPADISKSFGGGKVISQDEMRQRDKQYEEKTIADETQNRRQAQLESKKEQDMKLAIDDAMNRAKGFMFMGDGNSAVKALESVKDSISWSSSSGGIVLLEYGMALEAVGRHDDARSVYGKLASVSLSSGVRRQAIGLISGLDVIRQLKKRQQDNNSSFLSSTNGLQFQSIERVLDIGVQSQWSSSMQNSKAPRPWLGIQQNIPSNFPPNTTIENIKDAYNILLSVLDPLKSIPSNILARACRKLFMSSDVEKLEFGKNRAQSIIFHAQTNSRISESRPFNEIANGTWDLVVSLIDRSPYSFKRYDFGDVRRSLNFEKYLAVETSPVFWGLGQSSRSAELNWDALRYEITLSSDGMKYVTSPWHKRGLSTQSFQVIYCDQVMQLTREKSSEIGGPDLYTVWKRKYESTKRPLIDSNQFIWKSDEYE